MAASSLGFIGSIAPLMKSYKTGIAIKKVIEKSNETAIANKKAIEQMQQDQDQLRTEFDASHQAPHAEENIDGLESGELLHGSFSETNVNDGTEEADVIASWFNQDVLD
jgi:hypothetical protein